MRSAWQALRGLVRVSVFAGLGCLAIPLALGTTHIVDGSGGGDFTTIADAMASPAVIAGDTVLVMPGTYVENIMLKGGVKLLGSGPDVTILDGNAAGPVVTLPVNGDYNNVVSGFTITNGQAFKGAGIAAVNPLSATKSLGRQTITRNVIEGNHAVRDGNGLNGYGGGIAIYKTECDHHQQRDSQ